MANLLKRACNAVQGDHDGAPAIRDALTAWLGEFLERRLNRREQSEGGSDALHLFAFEKWCGRPAFFDGVPHAFVEPRIELDERIAVVGSRKGEPLRKRRVGQRAALFGIGRAQLLNEAQRLGFKRVCECHQLREGRSGPGSGIPFEGRTNHALHDEDSDANLKHQQADLPGVFASKIPTRSEEPDGTAYRHDGADAKNPDLRTYGHYNPAQDAGAFIVVDGLVKA